MKNIIFSISIVVSDLLYLLKMFPVRTIIIVLVILSFIGCKKDSPILKGVNRVVEGIVFEDCKDNVSQGKKIYLQYAWIGCFGGGIISRDSTMTDGNGHFIFHYTEYEHEQSTTSYFYTLTIPNSTIGLCNPNGNYDLYPNDTTMNAIIHLKFHNTYTSVDTFYFQFKPTPNGVVHDPILTQFFVGPFHDTTLVLNNLPVGNVNSHDNGTFYSGEFKWGIGEFNLSRYYTGRDGHFYFTHQPCATADTFEYHADPI
jgi:hypothetical protein